MEKNTGYDGEQRINLGNAEVAADLKNLLSRIRSVNPQAAVRLVASNQVMAVYVSTLAPETLLDTTPTILGMRAVRLPEVTQCDVVVEASALLDRLARIEEENYELSIPPMTVTAVWAGIQAPVSGWQEREPVSGIQLRQVAQEGMAAVDGALPDNPGHAVVSTVRSRIWASPIDALHMAGEPDYLPSGAAFAAVVLGFLPQDDAATHRRFTCAEWTRLNLPAGYILVRQSRGI